MEPIFALTPDQFRAALAELGLDAEREADLIRQYNEINGPQEGAGRRGMMYNLLDNIIGYDDDIVTPGERLGAGVQDFASGLLSDPLGTGADIVRGGYETIERAMAPGATPMDVLGAAGMAMGAGGMAAAPRGALAANALRNVDEYAGSHRAPSRQYGASFDDPREMFGGDDIYTSRATNYFGHGDRQMDMESIRAISAARGNPDAEITVYRAVPRDLEGAEVNAGDWVSPSRRYAELHGEGPLGGDYQIIEQRVRAGDLFTDGDIHEWGYSPELSANRSTTAGLLASAASDTPAQQVARLLREGRADEVTDDLMAQADPQEMFRLYEAGETGANMPMDEASRMARAREMGLADDQYHATTANFPAFMPSQTGLAGRGVYTGDFATDVTDYARAYGAEGLNVIPVRTPPEASYARRIDWQNTVDADPDFPYDATVDETVAGFARAADRMSGQGYSGVLSQPGERVTFNPENIRSRFARFDPRLSHLANLNAANIDPLTGAVAMGASQQQNTDPLANLRAYIAQYGGVLGR